MTSPLVVAVTGATGFIGRHLCVDLLRRGYSVRALTRSASAAIPGVEICPIPDLLDVVALRLGLRDADVLIHLAGRAHVMFDGGYEPYKRLNVDGTRAVIRAAREESVRQIIFSSSVKAIGEGGEFPLTDDTPETPRDAYGRSKLEAEGVLRTECDAAGIALTVVRLPVVYGPEVKGNIRRLFDAVWRGFPVPLSRTPNARSMLGIDNLLAFVHAVLERPLNSERPYLLSDAETVSTKNLIHLIAIGLGRVERVVRLPIELLATFASIGDLAARLGLPVFTSEQLDRLTGSLIVDSERAWREAGVQPPAPLAEGIGRTADWYRENHR